MIKAIQILKKETGKIQKNSECESRKRKQRNKEKTEEKILKKQLPIFLTMAINAFIFYLPLFSKDTS